MTPFQSLVNPLTWFLEFLVIIPNPFRQFFLVLFVVPILFGVIRVVTEWL